jgi:hypothetical protein
LFDQEDDKTSAIIDGRLFEFLERTQGDQFFIVHQNKPLVSLVQSRRRTLPLETVSRWVDGTQELLSGNAAEVAALLSEHSDFDIRHRQGCLRSSHRHTLHKALQQVLQRVDSGLPIWESLSRRFWPRSVKSRGMQPDLSSPLRSATSSTKNPQGTHERDVCQRDLMTTDSKR